MITWFGTPVSPEDFILLWSDYTIYGNAFVKTDAHGNGKRILPEEVFMPRAPSSEPLQRTDLNLYAADIDFLKRTYGQGWTTYIRELVRKDVERKPRMKTVGEMIDET